MRYIPHTEEEIQTMLSEIGVSKVEDLFRSIPNEVKLKQPLNLPPALSELEILKELENIGKENLSISKANSFLGAGSYNHFVPAAVSDIASRSEWLTPYTPYQPELSQGTLQALFEYQTMICNLVGMDVSNASHYDGATATAEAAFISCHKTRRNNVVAASTLHPEYRDVMKTIFHPQGKKLVEVPFAESGELDLKALKEAVNKETASVVVQTPNFFGIIEDLEEIGKIAHEVGALFIVAIAEPISLGLLEGPGKFGANIVTGEGQAFGSGINYGGPYLGIFTVTKKLLRQMPGRVSGQTVDTEGRRGFVLTMSTREQHIRREKALSNICSNEALLATTAAIYLSLMGKEGLKKLAEINLANSTYLKNELAKINGVDIQFSGSTFNEFVIRLNKTSLELMKELLGKGIFPGIAMECWYPEFKNHLLVCTTECHSKEDLDNFINAVKENMES